MDPKPLKLDLLTQKFINKFWSLVTKTETCWVWEGYRTTENYGMISHKNFLFPTHRLVYYFHNKVDPYPLFVLHTCDNPICLNPDHLYLGTRKDNANDRKERGRTNIEGSLNRHAKLTEDNVLEIRAKHKEGYTNLLLSLEYEVSDATICMIVNNKAWQHI